MAAFSDYQVQYRRRLKQGLRRRTEADRKVRAYARRLAEALDEAVAAGEVLTYLNQLYSVAVETVAPTGKVVRELVEVPALRQALLKAPTVVDLVVPCIADTKAGQALPADVRLGEWIAQVPVKGNEAPLPPKIPESEAPASTSPAAPAQPIP